ncbi:MAG: Rubrerythrin [Thermoplasmata archaeon]|nr:MAG: Rubrerythrin [Thermoplasmata archaeon]
MLQLKEILEIAIKAEIDAADVYKKLAESVDIFLLKDKFHFLENEEKGHRRLLEKIFENKFPGKEIILPDKSQVPLPEVKIEEGTPLSSIISRAMEAERVAAEFYKEMEKEMGEEKEKVIARYLSSMEESHYYLLKSEREIAYNFELYDEVHEMMHVGP